jgi:hypothetical protein
MRRIDELHLEFPFAGSRMLRGLLAAEGSKIGRRHIATLMRRMGIEAIYRRPNTSNKAEREASPTAAIIDSQSVKSAAKGGPASIRTGLMRAS